MGLTGVLSRKSMFQATGKEVVDETTLTILTHMALPGGGGGGRVSS